MCPTASILISCALSSHGGNETHVQGLCALLRAEGCGVTVATRSRDFAATHGRNLAEHGVEVVTTPFDSAAPAALRNTWSATVWPLGSLRRRYTRLIAIGPGGFHRLMVGRLAPGGTSLYWEAGDAVHGMTPAHQRMLGAMDALAATSRPVATRVSAATGRPVAVLSPLTPVPSSAPLATRLPGPGRVQVGFVGRVSRLKGVDLLLRAWAVTGLDADLHLHGDGAEASEMAELAKSLGIGNAVRFHGPFDRSSGLLGVLAGLDLLVLPSHSEGLPHVLVEAMAFGLPFVATNVGGISDLAEGNPGAILVEPTPESVGDGLREAVGRLRRGRMDREAILALYRERYSPDVVGRRWLAALGLGRGAGDVSGSAARVPSV